MKKINNNKFRGNAVYSLNYKFDSVSPAGKCSGTALDLIKRYNELAKEAQNNGDYVGMEVFRQYAEHYRKIVTEINERKYQTRDNQSSNATNNAENQQADAQTPVAENNLVETQSAAPEVAQPIEEASEPAKKVRRTRAFTVVDASKATEKVETPAEETAKPRRRVAARKTAKTAEKVAE